MIELIQKYLSAHRRVELEGWGILELKPLSAQLDFPNRILNPPYYTLQFFSEASGSELFLKWLSNEKNISIEEASSQLKEFISQFLSVLQTKKKIDWNGWGIFFRTTDGKTKFQSILTTVVSPSSVKAERIIRKGAEHQVRVGEDQKTNTEMELLLAETNSLPQQKWWIAACMILLLGAVLTWYFSSAHRLQWKQQSNYRQIEPSPTPEQYKEPVTTIQ
jgi:nucleoid DNA-binding protein